MMNNFAVFIMVYGRPENNWTYRSLRVHGYTGKIYLVADNTDSKIGGYKKRYKDELVVFDKFQAAKDMDSGDNSGDLRSTLFSANTIKNIAADMGIKHFFIMCDDYTSFIYKFNKNLEYQESKIKSLDYVFQAMVAFYERCSVVTVAMAQNGDFIGGGENVVAREKKLLRKAMNSFLCSPERPFNFMGRLNEDVTTYVNLGAKGVLFFTVPLVAIIQKPTQSVKGGLTEVYLDNGTYVKSFFSVMYNPSCVKVSEMGDKHKRIHHKIKWKNAVPVILNEKYCKKIEC